MQLVESENTAYYKFDQLSGFDEMVHFVSTRRGGVSQDTFASLNLGFGTGDDPARVLKNRLVLADSVGVPLESFVMLNQVHKSRVEIVVPEMKGMGAFDRESAIHATDSMITNERGICLFVMAADCVPLLFFDPVKSIIGACHAGWRGTVNKAAVATVNKMVDAFGCRAGDIFAAIGPSIGPCCYAIGSEVIDSVLHAFGSTDQFIRFGDHNGLPYFDLWVANKLQLLEAGLDENHIELSALCTCCHHNEFFSSRYDKAITGRFGAGIMLK